MSDIAGKTIRNRYRVDSFVGRGGMAEVYKVWGNERGVHLAMKLCAWQYVSHRLTLVFYGFHQAFWYFRLSGCSYIPADYKIDGVQTA